MNIGKLELRDREESFINLNPLQTGGRTTSDARKIIISYIDGYSICDWCKGALHITTEPDIAGFLGEVSDFLGMDYALPTNGCREAKYGVMHSISTGGSILCDGNMHYSSEVAAERAGLKIYKVPNKGEPEFKINPADYAEGFELVKKETGKYPELALLTHVDGEYGNLVDAKEVGKICNDYSVPFLLNTAYSSGRMEISGKKIGADFIACSGHKSWAAGGGNIGILAVKEGWQDKVFKPGTNWKSKPIEILGCSTRGASLMALMASFPHVKERVKNWDEEVKKARYLVNELEKIDMKQLGEKPKNHDLIKLDTPVYDNIAKTHKKKGYFLYYELKDRGIIGMKPGRTRKFKISTYGLSWEQVGYVAESFLEIGGG